MSSAPIPLDIVGYVVDNHHGILYVHLSTPDALRLREMKQILADDPIGQTIFYREMATLFSEIALGAALTSL